jgi:uncharacterized protein (DUF885 family)
MRLHASRSLSRIAPILLMACATAGGRSAVPTPAPHDGAAASEVTRVADEYWRDFTAAFPISILFFGAPGGANDRLDDNSLASVRRWEEKEDRWLAAIEMVDTVALAGRPEAATYGVLRETLESSVQSRVCHREYWSVSQLYGTQVLLPYLSELQPLGTPQLRSQALARWRDMPRYVNTEIANLREGLTRGYSTPQANVRTVIEQLDQLLAASPSESQLSAMMTRDSTPGFGREVVGVVEHDVLPALGRYRAFLADQYLPRARTSTNLSALPDGEACYRALVRSATTLDLEPKVVQELGVREMANIDAEMKAIAERSFGTADVPALLSRMRDDPQFKFRTREEIIETATAAVARAKAAMPRWFGRLPKADFIVDPCEPYEEKSACPGSYTPGTVDGSRPGRYRINAGNPTGETRAWAEGTAFHEGIPGHHLQWALAQELTNAHPVTRFIGFPGFGEGWALYAERLALEMNLYSSDLQRFGEWGEQGLRAARLVVDPGLHVFGWSRERAIEYMLQHLTESRASIESEVDRYIVNPGQATAYMVGRLEIERLRQLAETRLGPRFDIREFHDHVLGSGSVPLGQLKRQIEEWLAAAASACRNRCR